MKTPVCGWQFCMGCTALMIGSSWLPYLSLAMSDVNHTGPSTDLVPVLSGAPALYPSALINAVILKPGSSRNTKAVCGVFSGFRNAANGQTTVQSLRPA